MASLCGWREFAIDDVAGVGLYVFRLFVLCHENEPQRDGKALTVISMFGAMASLPQSCRISHDSIVAKIGLVESTFMGGGT